MELPDSERVRCYRASVRDAKLKKDCVVPVRKTKHPYKHSLYNSSYDHVKNLRDDVVTSEQVICKGPSPLDCNDKKDCEVSSPTSTKQGNEVNYDYGDVRNFIHIPTAPCIEIALLNKDDGTDDDDYDPYYGDLRNSSSTTSYQPPSTFPCSRAQIFLPTVIMNPNLTLQPSTVVMHRSSIT